MKSIMRSCLGLFVLLTVITGVIYPVFVTGLAKTLFPSKAAGSIVYQGDQAIGSELIGQNFTDAKYFWGRPSATGPQPYNATASSGSNQGPLNPALADAVKGRIEALQSADPGNTLPIPMDLVTASASGLPISRTMIAPSSCARSMCNCPMRRTTAARSAMDPAAHASWEAAAASTAVRIWESVAVG